MPAAMPRRTGSSKRWRQRQERDIYVEQAGRAGWRSRAVFKLEQILAKERLLKPGTVCVDLGSAPGSWSQLAARLVGASGRVVAIDLLPMDAIPSVEFLQGDFTAPETLAELRRIVGAAPVDLVMSDMAPNISGNRAMDQPRSMALVEEAFLFASEVLRPGGDLLVKAFQGEGIDAFTRELRQRFATVRTIKPKASRPESREIYLLARNFGM
jgi:23S rRNA (uridine2552-2'-O)-methyltransferase